MMSLAAAASSFEKSSAALFASRRSTGAAEAGSAGAETSGTAEQASISVAITRSSATSLQVEASDSPRGRLAGRLASADKALDRLLAQGTEQPEPSTPEADKLDKLKFLLDSLNLILKDRSLGGDDKLALLSYLSNVANGQEPSEDAKKAFGAAMSDVLDRRRWPEGRKDDYRELLGKFATLPEPPAGGEAETSGSASVSQVESLSISIKGAFQVVTDQGTMSAEFEFSSEMVQGFSAAIDDGESVLQAFSARSSSLSLRIAATGAYAEDPAATGSTLDKAA
ncbi:hypothetical protein [Prosthecomicrobium sp. N25]|uniref:hypothetical protein n=1 Tax=Prosthecomicrobium sp. N25 TaxID=3129254 RepID=UPI003076A831